MADVEDLRARLAADRVTTTHAQDTAEPVVIVNDHPALASLARAAGLTVGQPTTDRVGTLRRAAERAIGRSSYRVSVKPSDLLTLVALVDARDAAIQAVLNYLVQRMAEAIDDATHSVDDPAERLERQANAAADVVLAAVVSALDGNGQNT